MANNYILLDRIELNQSASSVTFSNIPQTGYTDLKLVMSGRSDRNSFTSTYVNVSFNGSSSGYSSRVLVGNGGSALSYTNIEGTSAMGLMVISQANNTANTYGNGELYIPNYAGSSNKSVSADSVQEDNNTTGWQFLGSGLWSNTAAITSITLQPISGGTSFSFLSGSTFSLYGIAAVGTTPVIAPKADGGNVIATDGTYWYHAFLSNGTFTPQVGLNADVLVVAGGGGGGGGVASAGSGGGGAGGLLAFTSQSLSTTGYACTVGSGGAGGNGSNFGTNGVDSQFGSLTLVKGGGGGGYYNTGTVTGEIGKTGGSGGGSGGGFYNVAGGSATAGQGNDGGSTTGGSPYAGSGGGGAGAAGSGTNGGNGLNTWSAWATATSTGVSGYYAGGGAGGGGLGSNGTAGSGGGGAVYVNGTTNTGGGGGGAKDATTALAANGGSGIIIIRYAV